MRRVSGLRRPRAALAAVLTISVVVAGVASPAQAKPKAAPPPRLSVQKEHVVPGVSVQPQPYAPDPAAAAALTGAPPAAVWPAAATATVDLGGAAVAGAGLAGLAGTGGRAVRAGTMPVLVAPADGAGSSRSAALNTPAPARVRVDLLDRAAADPVGPGSVVLRIGRADGVAAPAAVDLSLDTSGFARAYGADYASRLLLETVPACARPDPGCRPQPLATRRSGTVLTATVVAAGAGSAATTVAAVAAPSGPSGSFSATTLAASGSWQAGGASGDFAWSYPLRVPPGVGGPVPQLGIAYSAQSVDGRHAASNNQPSWLGEGFDLWSGYIERRYKSCAEDMGGGANNTVKTGDECWATDNATMSLGGKTVEVIRDDATGTWHPKSDDASRIEHLTGAANGDNDGEYWKVTTADGTQYFFGRNRLPGWSSGKPETNAVWTMPVFGNNAGEPCHQAAFDASWCAQAWRWNLDHVVDPHGNSMSYYYGTETNKYARDLDPAKVTSYIRAGYLTEIDYGTRADAEYATAPARVLFTVADRCLPNSTCDTAHPASWPDVPWDQNCAGSTCTQAAPTFWTAKRLASIKTQVRGSSAYRDVEQWTFTHTYPDPGDGTRAGLWLSKISHTGLVGGSAAVPDVTLTGVQMHNRVDTVDGSPAMNWWRLASIRTESGGEISVTYTPQDCAAGTRMPAAPETNTMRCYPVRWTPPGYADPITDWFNKYVVTAVSETDHTGGAPRVLTQYDYQGPAAWHYTDDDGLVEPADKTWSQWRGYEVVGVTKGDPGTQTYEETRFFRGMDGDHLPSGKRTVQIADSRGGTVADSDVFSGQVRQKIVYNGPGGAVVSDVLSDLWQSAPSATRTRDGVTTYARYTNSSVTSDRTMLDGGRGYRERNTSTTYDQYGAAVETTDYGDTTDPGDDQCTTYTYARNTTAWILNAVSRVQAYALSCDKTPTSAGQIIGDTRTSFDGGSFGAAPTKADATAVESVKAWSGGVATYFTESRSGYDAYGRLTDSWDADGAHSTIAYTTTSGPVTRTVQTNELGWTTTTDLEPAWGSALTTTDANGQRTDVTYDPLGRTSAVWLPGRAKGVLSANVTYSYLVRTDGAVAVTTGTLGPNGTPITSYALYDSLLRTRQTQAPAFGPDGGRIITDTIYDAAGRAYKTDNAYVADGVPGTDLFAAADNQIPSQTRTLYDGADRPIASILYSLGTPKWQSSTAYGGDHMDATPPPGGIAVSAVADVRGHVIEQRQYHGPAPTGAYDSVRYTYTASGQLASVTDPGGNRWTYGYDTRGRQTSITDPDRGNLSTAYDDAGRELSTTDGRGTTLTYSYDALNRKIAEFDAASGTKLADWTYDTLAKGQLTSATRYVDGNAYTTAVTGYDAAYRPTGSKITIPAVEGSLAGSYQFAATYKPNGSPSTATLPLTADLPAETLGFTYGTLGELTGVSGYLTGLQYTRLGEPAVYTLSTGGPIAQIGNYYDEATRRLQRRLVVRQTAPSTVADMHWSYDAAGNVTSISDTPAGATSDVQCFSYDYQRRLTDAWTPGSGDCAAQATTAGLGGPAPYWQSFSYDVIGNRTKLTDHLAAGDRTTTYAYPAAGAPQPHAVQSSTVTDTAGSTTGTYGYDPAGDTTRRPTTGSAQQDIAWDAEGHVASVTDATGTASYVYDPTGQRLISHDHGGSTLYLPGVEIRATSPGKVTATRYYSAGNVQIAQRSAAGTSWLAADHQGTTQVAIDAAGQTVTQRRQKPFGESRGTVATWPSTHGFVNGTNDPTGLVHEGAREYDPGAGRFLSADPVFDANDPQQMASYAYAANTPVTASDPSGLMYTTAGAGGGGGGQQQQQQQPPQQSGCGWNPLCYVQNAWNTAKNFVNDQVTNPNSWWNNQVTNVKNMVSSGIQQLRDFAASVQRAATALQNQITTQIQNAVKAAQQFAKAAQQVAQNLLKAAQQTAAKVWQTAKKVTAAVVSFGKAFAVNLIPAVVGVAVGWVVGKVVTAVCTAVASAISAVCSAVGNFAGGFAAGWTTYWLTKKLANDRNDPFKLRDAIIAGLVGGVLGLLGVENLLNQIRLPQIPNPLPPIQLPPIQLPSIQLPPMQMP